MSRRIILVRAVNVGGTARLPMAPWRTLAESLGATEVTSYIASGNQLCTPPGQGWNSIGHSGTLFRPGSVSSEK